MKKLSFEKMENLTGGCSFEEALALFAASTYYWDLYRSSGYTNTYYAARSLYYGNQAHACI